MVADKSSPAPTASEACDPTPPNHSRWALFRAWVVRAWRWHLLAFTVLNAILTVINVALAGGWWAFWPLQISTALLLLHYLFYKAMTVSDRWADERVEELNLKSYDRAHIEELKARLGPSAADERNPRSQV